jgi:hypothetical protein
MATSKPILIFHAKIRMGFFVTTLILGLQLRQGLVRVRAKKETQESHFMLLGV